MNYASCFYNNCYVSKSIPLSILFLFAGVFLWLDIVADSFDNESTFLQVAEEVGQLLLEKKVERKPIEEWIKYQGRFSHLFKPERDEKRLQSIQNFIDHLWERYRNRYLKI